MVLFTLLFFTCAYLRITLPLTSQRVAYAIFVFRFNVYAYSELRRKWAKLRYNFRHNDENLTCSDIEFEATEIHKRDEQMIAEDAAIPEVESAYQSPQTPRAQKRVRLDLPAIPKTLR